MTRRQITATIAAGAAGLAAAFALTAAPAAQAYAPDELPSLGYAVSVLALGNNCHSWSATGYGAHADFGSDCEPGFQAAVDAFVAVTCPCAQPPATTTTQATTTAPATTDTATTGTTAPAAAEPPAQAATGPVTAPTGTDVQAQIDALNARLDALQAQVNKLTDILAAMPGLDPLIRDAIMATKP